MRIVTGRGGVAVERAGGALRVLSRAVLVEIAAARGSSLVLRRAFAPMLEEGVRCMASGGLQR